MEEADRRILSTQNTQIRFKPHIFSQTCTMHTVAAGATLYEAIQILRYPKEFESLLQIYIKNQVVPQSVWHKTQISEGEQIFVAFVPGKGGQEKNPLNWIASVALIAVAPAAGLKLAGYLGVTGKVGVALVTAGFTVIGSSVINSVFPPPAGDFNQLSGRDVPESQNYRADAARNKLEIEGAVISLYGKHRMFPNYAASPFTVMSGDTQYIHMLFDAGYGYVDISEQRFGENRLLSTYDEIELRIHHNFQAGDLLDFFATDVFTETYSLEVSKDVSRTITTQLDCDEAQIDLTFNRGLTSFDNSGNRTNRKVRIKMFFRLVGATDWLPLRNAKYVNFTAPEFVATAGMYDVQIILNAYAKNVSTTYKSSVSVTQIIHRYGIYVFSNKDSIPRRGDFVRINNVNYEITSSSTQQSGHGWSTRIGFNRKLPNIRRGQTLEIQTAKYEWDEGASIFTIISGKYAPKINDKLKINGDQYNIDAVSVLTAGQKYEVTLSRGITFKLEADEAIYNSSSRNTAAFLHIKNATLIDSITSNSTIDIERATAQTFTVGVNFRFPATNQYEILVQRETADSDSDRVFDTFSIAQMRSIQYVSPITPDKPRTLIEMKVKVNEQINGLIDDYNFIGQRHLRVGDGLGNYTIQATRNPAWVALDILTGDIAPRPLPLSKINHQSFKDFADWCDQENADGEAKFMCDFVMDFQSTVRQLVNQIVAVGRGILIQVDGIFEIAIDQPKNTPKQLFTPRNTNGFTGTRSYPDRKDFIKARFVDSESGYKLRNYKVYDDDKDATNSTTFESYDAFGITRARQAYEQTRWAMSQSILRSTQYTFRTDIEYLTCKRGDLVLLQNDVPRAGGLPARIVNKVEFEEDNQIGTKIYFDRDIIDQGISSYDLFIRQSDGIILQISGMSIVPGEANALKSTLRDFRYLFGNRLDETDPFEDVLVGDLVVYGEPESTVKKCIVKEIVPQDVLSAEITLTDYADAIFDADTGELPEYTPEFSNTEINSVAPDVVESVVFTQDIDYKDRFPVIAISINWNSPKNSSYAATFEIYKMTDEGVYELIDIVTKSPYVFTQTTRQDQSNVFGKTLTFKILPVSNTGNKLNLSKVAPVKYTPQKDNVAPAAVSNLNLKLLQSNIQLTWTNPTDVDFDGVEIRRSSDGQWDNAQSVANLNHVQTEVTLDPVKAYYLARAKDTSGNLGPVVKVNFSPDPPIIRNVDIFPLGDSIRVDVSYSEGSAQIKKFRLYNVGEDIVLVESENSIFDFIGAINNLESGSLYFDIEIQDFIGQKVRVTTGEMYLQDGKEYFNFGEVDIVNDVSLSYASNAVDSPGDAPTNGRAIKFEISSTSGSHPTMNTTVSKSGLELPTSDPHLSIASAATAFSDMTDWANTVIPNGGSILTAIENTSVSIANSSKHVSTKTLVDSGHNKINWLGKKAQINLRYMFGRKKIKELLINLKDVTILNNFPSGEMPVIKKFIRGFTSVIYPPPFFNSYYMHPVDFPIINNAAILHDVLAFDIIFEVYNRVPNGTTNDIILSFPSDFLTIKALMAQNSGATEIIYDPANPGDTTIVETEDYFYDPTQTPGDWDMPPQATVLDVNRGYVEIEYWSQRRFWPKVYDASGNRCSGKIRWTRSGIVLSSGIPEVVSAP